MSKGWEAVQLDQLDAIPVAEGLVWHPVRRRLGIRAFGMNAYTSESAGQHVVEEHDELVAEGGGHEEVYIVMRGHATFTVDGESLEAPAGTIVFIADPALKRMAIAKDADTLVLAVGGEPGKAYEIAPWESYFAAIPALKAGRFDEAIGLMQAGLELSPGNPSILFNLACAEALAGYAEVAIAHLQEAIASQPSLLERAQNDPDFDAIRSRSDFPA